MSAFEDYVFHAVCCICKKFDICRYDWLCDDYKCVAHGGTKA